ncbi:unnamed protein product [Onchocerca flexuosa]|uniref:Pentatricopeptide repeat-containing protein n=1 Tax=Onchocerca flexuosa TaxID=387005 RepID=A0A183HLZ6_9BILA|nr:unnamed protein product [Onchocerca flexuosa]
MIVVVCASAGFIIPKYLGASCIVSQHMAALLEQWVNDELYKLVGCSNYTAVQYVLALARKSTDAEDLLERLRNTDTMEDTPAVRKFASELIARVPHAAGKTEKIIRPSAAELHAKEIMRLNRSLKTIESDDEENIPSKKRKEVKIV